MGLGTGDWGLGTWGRGIHNVRMIATMTAIALLFSPLQASGLRAASKMITATKPDYYQANAEYLVFGKHKLAAVANPVLKKKAQTMHAEWVARTEKAIKDLGKPFAAWEHEVSMHAYYQTPSLLTVGVSTYDYSGGAHPNHWIEFMTFGTVAGKSRQLGLKDFFLPGFDYASHISSLVLRKLKSEEGADWVKNGEVKKLDAKMLQRFTPDKGGMVWFFNPYEVGPYAAGDFEVKLTLKDLGPKFKAALLK
jgi:hypothetical protein